MRPREHRAPRLPELCGLEPSSGANLGLSARCVGGAEQSRPGTEGTSGSRKTAGRRHDEAAALGPAVRTDGAAAPGPGREDRWGGGSRPGRGFAAAATRLSGGWPPRPHASTVAGAGGPALRGRGQWALEPGRLCGACRVPLTTGATRSLRRDPGRTARAPNTSFCNAATL